MGKKPHQGKKFKWSIKFLVELKANVIPYGSTLLCSEMEAFSLGKAGGAIRSDVYEQAKIFSLETQGFRSFIISY